MTFTIYILGCIANLIYRGLLIIINGDYKKKNKLEIEKEYDEIVDEYSMYFSKGFINWLYNAASFLLIFGSWPAFAYMIVSALKKEKQ